MRQMQEDVAAAVAGRGDSDAASTVAARAMAAAPRAGPPPSLEQHMQAMLQELRGAVWRVVHV